MKMIFDLNKELIQKIKKLYHCKTQKEAVEIALQEALKKKKREALAKKLGSFRLGLTLKELKKIREAG